MNAWRMVRGCLLLAAPVVFAAGCATPESQAVYDECQAEGLQRYPASPVDKLVRKEQKVQVPDGSTTCTTVTAPVSGAHPASGTRTETKCTQGSRTEIRYYNDVIQVDANREARDQFVAACHTRRCVERYSNPDCEVGKSGAVRIPDSKAAAPAKACYVDKDCGADKFCNNRADGSTFCQPR